MPRLKLLLSLLFVFAAGLARAENADDGEEQITQLTVKKTPPILLRKDDSIATKNTFHPPVDITVVAKTDSYNIRIGYADHVTFNWKMNTSIMKISEGPAGKQDKAGAGKIPTNSYVTIRFHVTPKKQSIYVDNNLRCETEADYSMINNPVSLWTAHEARVTVKSIKVKALPAGTE